MEPQKDTNANNRFHNGHPQGLSNSSNRQKGISGENAFAYIKRKAEKLTTALYLVTDILSDKEPMKWRVRETGVETLSDIMVAGVANASERVSNLRDVMRKIEKIVAFLDVAQSTRMMTEMNASMLKKEYVALRDNVEEEWSRIAERSRDILTESFFALPPAPPEKKNNEAVGERNILNETSGRTAPPAPAQAFPELKRTEGEKRQENDQRQLTNFVSKDAPQAVQIPNIVSPSSRDGAYSAHPGASFNAPSRAPIPVFGQAMSQSERVQNQSASFTRPENRPLNRTQPEVGRNDRRKIILALIKQKPSLTVKDIAKSISHVSEKTIQRELLAMVAEGILTKKGERRWSTYSLR